MNSLEIKDPHNLVSNLAQCKRICNRYEKCL